MFNLKNSSLLSISIILGFSINVLFLAGCNAELGSKLVESTKILQKKEAMVVSAHPLASEIGKRVMQKGGNAVDAAVAVQFALAVVYPVAGNIGGGGFMIYRSHDGEVSTLDFREMAPISAQRDMYLDENGEVIKGLSLNGHLAAGVPGSVAGMFSAHERYGKLPMAELIQPAIDLARKGFRVTEQQAKRLNDFKLRFIGNNYHTPAFVKDSPWVANDVLIQTDLSETLLRIALSGSAGFYSGKTADLIIAEMKKGGGIITKEDLSSYQAKWRRPLLINYKNYALITMPPPSSGGVALAQILGMLKEFDLSKYGFHSPMAVHLMVEAERRAYADRAEHLGDSDYYPVPMKTLLDQDYIKSRAATIDTSQASLSSDIYAGEMASESEETTHFSIIDQDGNAVSITTTINSGYGSKTVVEGAGFLLNNEMDDFSAKPGTPNFYGLLGAEANAIAPGKRMLSSMTPTIVTKEGKLHLVVGTPGGSTIITSVLQVFLNISEFGLGTYDAVARGRFHHQWLPDKIQYEEGALSDTTMEALKAMGHSLKQRGSIGKVEAIRILDNGMLEGAADPRGDDSAAGF